MIGDLQGDIKVVMDVIIVGEIIVVFIVMVIRNEGVEVS